MGVGMKIENEKQRNRNNNDFLADASTKLLSEKEKLDSFSKTLDTSDDHYYNTTMLIFVLAKDEEELMQIEEKLFNAASLKSLKLKACFGKQGAKYRKTFGEVKPPNVEVLAKSLYFTPNPVTVEFLTKEEALRTGHYRVGYSETLIYQIIIKDISDRELWLTYPIEDILKTNPLSMKEVYEVLGIEVEEETLPDKLKYLLGLSPRKIFGRYAVKGAI